jgi:D-alanyl-lipoteichoic acid acyltransferase DltB (MBOAT superfamily)
MSFDSIPFFVLLAASLAAFWAIPRRRARLAVLLVASYVFYFEWSYKYALLLLFSTVLDYTVGNLLARARHPRWRLALLLTSLVGNLGVLGFFKYWGFFAESFVRFSETIGLPVSLPVAKVLLPVGISFYTFQTLSYTIDLYRGRIEPCRDLLRFSVFVAFFPQLVAGPIERARNLLPQLGSVESKSLSPDEALTACTRIAWGLFKKIAVANSLALHVDYLFEAHDLLGAPGTLLAAVGFGLQIYCDFSAYSDIAIGTASLFGIRIMENFRAPYAAASPQAFWRRWHISLSTWFRDYLYFPLGGSRKGRSRTVLNLLFVMLVVGLWHGANVTFILWGALHGAALAVGRLWQRKSAAPVEPREAGLLRTAAGWAATLAVVHLGWVLFRAGDLGVFLDMCAALFTLRSASLPVDHTGLVLLWLCIVVLEHAAIEWHGRAGTFRRVVRSPRFRLAALGFLAVMDLAFFVRVDAWNAAFIYFAF